MTVDFTELKRHGKDTVTPVVITNPEAVCKLSCEAGKCDGDGYIALRYVKEEKQR
jgi:phosphotransferase system IIA component